MSLRHGRVRKDAICKPHTAAQNAAHEVALRVQGDGLLCKELQLHQVDAAKVHAIAKALLDLAIQRRSAARLCKAAVRDILRGLRQRRADGNFVKIDAATCSIHGLALDLWTEHVEQLVPKSDALRQASLEHCLEGIPFPLVPPMECDADKVCFVVKGILTNDECQRILQLSEAKGWQQASVEYGFGDQAGEEFINTRLRDSDRCVVYDEELAEQLWRRLQPFIPSNSFKPLAPVRINSCFRCLRYSEGQAGLGKHMDGHSVVSGELSKITVQLYLNDGFEGGATRLCVTDDAADAGRSFDVIPCKGMAFVFDQRLWHAARSVTRGVKYAARTEIMYSGSA